MNLVLITYPCYLTIYGPSKRSVTKYNRAEYDEYIFQEKVFNEEELKQKIDFARNCYQSDDMRVSIVYLGPTNELECEGTV